MLDEVRTDNSVLTFCIPTIEMKLKIYSTQLPSNTAILKA